MWRTIQKLKEKPKSHRRKVTAVVSVLITAIIFALWYISFDSKAVSKDAGEPSPGPLESIGKQIKSIF